MNNYINNWTFETRTRKQYGDTEKCDVCEQALVCMSGVLPTEFSVGASRLYGDYALFCIEEGTVKLSPLSVKIGETIVLENVRMEGTVFKATVILPKPIEFISTKITF